MLYKLRHELCKRLHFLLNFYNSLAVRDKAIDLLNLFLDVVTTSDALLSIIHSIYLSYSHSGQLQLGPCALHPSGEDVKTVRPNGQARG